MGKRRSTTTTEPTAETCGFNSLPEMLKAKKLSAGARVYKVCWPDGKGGGRTKYVITNSPMRAAAACCHVDRVENIELIRAYSDLIVPPPAGVPAPLLGQSALPLGDGTTGDES